MRLFSFALTRLAYLLTITRVDGTVIRVTTYSRAITFGSNTWTPAPGLEIGDITETNRGDIPSVTFRVALGGLFTKLDINASLYEAAECLLELTNAATPSTKDEEFVGILKGDIQFDLDGNAKFEILNKFGLNRDVFVRKYSIEDDVDFGDPRRSKIPTFPTVDATSDDLAVVPRSTALALGERRRFDYDSVANPSTYHDVHWEVTTAGTTGASAPVAPGHVIGSTVADGTVTFTIREAYARAFQVASIIDENHITITVTFTDTRATDPTWWAPGMLVMRTGTLKNRGSDVDAWDGISQVGLVVPFANYLEIGDWGEIAPDYDQTLDMAVAKYDNANNYRGFPHLTGARLATSTYVPGTTPSPAPGPSPGPGPSPNPGPTPGGGYSAAAVEFEDGTG